MKISIDQAIDIFEQSGRIVPDIIKDQDYNDENIQAIYVAHDCMNKIKRIEDFIQVLGVQEPVLTFRELTIYKKLKEICGV